MVQLLPKCAGGVVADCGISRTSLLERVLASGSSSTDNPRAALHIANWVTSVRLAGRVEKVEGGTAYLVYEGEIAATHVGTKDEGKEGKQCSSSAKLLGGAGAYDVKSGRLQALTLVFDGQFRNYAPYDAPARFGAVVEWAQEPTKR